MDNTGNSSQAPINGQIKKPFQWPHDNKQDEGVKEEKDKTEDKEEKMEEKVLDSTQKNPTNQSQDSVIHYPYGPNAKNSATSPLTSPKQTSTEVSTSKTKQNSFQLLKDDDRRTIDELKAHALKMVAEERAEIERQAEERKKQLATVEESLNDPRITEAFYYLTKAKEKVSGSPNVEE